LKPFPTAVSIEYKFHKSCVRSISVSPCGQFLASGDEDHNLVVWHILTSRIMRKYKLTNKVVDCVEWNPNKGICMISAANEELVYLIQPQLYNTHINTSTATLISETKANYI
jgi:WD40 repeat protein